MEPWLAACRFTHVFGLMAGFGVALYIDAFAPRELRAGLTAMLRPVTLAGALAALLAGVLWLGLEAPAMSGDAADFLSPEAWSAVAFDTAFGQVWLPRLALLLALVATLSTPLRAHGRLTLALWAAALASLALAGHASMQSGPAGATHRAADALHLLCAGGWLGGLAGYLASLRLYRRGAARSAAVAAMMRFSAWGHLAVALLFASGLVNVLLTGGLVSWTRLSPYRALLLLKICIFLSMACIAIFNRYVIVPRLQAHSEGATSLTRLCATQILLAAAAVGLVSWLGLLDPS